MRHVTRGVDGKVRVFRILSHRTIVTGFFKSLTEVLCIPYVQISQILNCRTQIILVGLHQSVWQRSKPAITEVHHLARHTESLERRLELTKTAVPQLDPKTTKLGLDWDNFPTGGIDCSLDRPNVGLAVTAGANVLVTNEVRQPTHNPDTAPKQLRLREWPKSRTGHSGNNLTTYAGTTKQKVHLLDVLSDRSVRSSLRVHTVNKPGEAVSKPLRSLQVRHIMKVLGHIKLSLIKCLSRSPINIEIRVILVDTLHLLLEALLGASKSRVLILGV